MLHSIYITYKKTIKVEVKEARFLSINYMSQRLLYIIYIITVHAF